MQVKLKVLVGKSAGKEITVPVSRFLIGRSKECHLRPKSDSISRNHCAILVGDNKVSIRDLNSRNGTLVNGERIEDELELNKGDRVGVGKLEFEMVIKKPKKAKKAKKPKKAEKAAEKVDSGSIDFDVTEWLEEADSKEVARRQAEPETRQFQLDETDRIQLEDASAEDQSEEDGQKKPVKPEKKEPGKLPQQPVTEAPSSREAAADMLKKFFNNR